MKALLTSFILSATSLTVVAQSNIKEGNNSFALYTQTGDIKNLENARKFSDAAFQTRKDSSSVRNNILRGLVYSSLAVIDSTRKQQYTRDPIDESLNTLKLINRKKAYKNFPTEVDYIKQNLATALIYKSNVDLKNTKVEDAYRGFLKVDSLGFKNTDLKFNLATLAVSSKNYPDAIKYYQELIKQDSPKPQYYLELASVYEKIGTKQDELNTLTAGRLQFPQNKEILFKLIDIYTKNESYDAILPIVDEAIKLEPENIELNYLAGYAYEEAKDMHSAKQYYNNVLRLDANNYASNLALGLIYLKDFLKSKSEEDKQSAQAFLLKANEIKPYDINALKALSTYYTAIEDFVQLDRVNILLNQLTVN
ncbi:tetratricopeptide repeat protein [Sphingobacterium sp. SRCM116780]|uniref:tetratricopeptide repeat protein n=1 Tax=Sphingobacterium sp. SRCM116780 TaxID=2907623 RepID=UPI001F4805E6|nr:tetratricopeptide repeat protein [Sphingobacterium sp. SRCM116780]UIR57761.1 tetratricopeptide repeat protein [Sphingobacterium sp. SRCM116780]